VSRYVSAYSRPGSTHAGFEMYRQEKLGADQVDALIAKDGKLTIPTLGVGGEHSFGNVIGTDLAAVATNVTTAVVPGSGHWVTEEKPTYVLNLITHFLQ
jgi:pimeloyl-ACP methyl ester carboxylesterase